MLIHLLQPYAMTYISRHRELFYKKVLLNISQYFSQTFLFFYNFDKKEALSQVVFDVKIQKTNVCKCFLRKCLYFCVYIAAFHAVLYYALLIYVQKLKQVIKLNTPDPLIKGSGVFNFSTCIRTHKKTIEK